MVPLKTKAPTATACRHRLRIAVALASAIFVGVPCASAQETSPDEGRPLTAAEIFMLIKDRSWQWPEGAGRFFEKDRRFLAYRRGADGASYGEGRYRLTDDGRLCLVTAWHSAAETAEATTCFLHRQADGVIYQRREDGGEWYALKHTPLLDTDEYAKFTSEDLVTEELQKVKSEIEANSSVQKGN